VVQTKFGKYVRSHVGCAGIVRCVELCSQLSIERERENNFPGTHELLRVLHSYSPDRAVVDVVSGSEFASASVVVAYANAGILVEPERKIRGIGRNADAVRCLQSPSLSTQKFPLTPFEVQPVEAQ